MSIDNLADPGEPMNGMPAMRSYEEVPNFTQTQHAVQRIRKTLRELPVPPKQMNGISVVFVYNMLGISHQEIAAATGITLEQVRRIIDSDAYQRLEGEIISSVLNNDSDDIKRIIAAGAQAAARKVVALIDDGDPAVALPASRDVLDRAGHKAADKLEINHNMALRIVYVDDKNATPVIDVTPEKE